MALIGRSYVAIEFNVRLPVLSSARRRRRNSGGKRFVFHNVKIKRCGALAMRDSIRS